MKNSILSIMLVFSVSVQAQNDDLTSLLKKISVPSGSEVFFVEERHAFYLEKPIKIQGRLKATPPDELEKTILSPESIHQVINGNKVIQSKSGTIVRESSLSDQPALSAIINSMRALLFGDIEYLRKTFEIQQQYNRQQWSLMLLPYNEEIKKQIKFIKVTGDSARINEFLVTEVNGDYSRTRLYESQ